MQTFKEFDETKQIDESLLKNPLTLFTLLGTYKHKINKAKDADEKIKLLATMLFISGQLNFNLIRSVEQKLEKFEAKFDQIRRQS